MEFLGMNVSSNPFHQSLDRSGVRRRKRFLL